jgi:hypothetical protein
MCCNSLASTQISHTCHTAGEGVAVDAAIAHDLFKRAAELGDPDAQADMAVRYSLGLLPISSNEDMLYELTTPNTPEALLNYFFAAAGNDTFAQMAMGYRHMYGVDVPQSCQAGLLYYNPVAERVVEAARYPGSLPQVVSRFMHFLFLLKSNACWLLPRRQVGIAPVCMTQAVQRMMLFTLHK